jgi:hypothetical protein
LTRLVAQIESEAAAYVASSNGFRTHDDEGPFPAPPESPRENPEELIEHVKRRSWVFALEGRELLPTNEIFEKQRPARAKTSKKRTQYQPNPL